MNRQYITHIKQLRLRFGKQNNEILALMYLDSTGKGGGEGARAEGAAAGRRPKDATAAAAARLIDSTVTNEMPF